MTRQGKSATNADRACIGLLNHIILVKENIVFSKFMCLQSRSICSNEVGVGKQGGDITVGFTGSPAQ